MINPLKKYSFKQYNPVYRELFRKEAARIKHKLGSNIIIDHIGSTSVPGLGGKGIIDMYLLVPKEAVQETSKKLQELGYEFKKNAGHKGRLFHQLTKIEDNKTKQHYHIHLTCLGNKNYAKSVTFRDILKNNPATARKYENIKKIAFSKIYKGDSTKKVKKIFEDIKGPFIEKVMNKGSC